MSNPFVGQSIRCAGPGCEHVRKECNHWFVISSGDFYFTCSPLNIDADLPKDVSPVCGSSCAQKLYEKWLNNKASWLTAGKEALDNLANTLKGQTQ